MQMCPLKIFNLNIFDLNMFDWKVFGLRLFDWKMFDLKISDWRGLIKPQPPRSDNKQNILILQVEIFKTSLPGILGDNKILCSLL